MGVIEVAVGRGATLGTLRVEVIQSAAGEASALTNLDVSGLLARRNELQYAVLASAVSTRRALTAAEECVREVGEALFGALLGSSEVSGRYRASAALMADRDDELRVVLRIDDPALAGLPWEAMYDELAGGYVCRLHQLVRHVPVGAAAAPLATDPPLRILAIASSPRDLPALDVGREKENLTKALDYVIRTGLVKLDWSTSATWPDLQDMMLSGRWHAVHFIGHGDLDPARDEGVIALTGEDGRKDLVGASRLVDLLHQAQPMPRLVVLNSCSGAVSGTSDMFSSTAAALARRGVTAVIAMQYEISDPAAVAFCRGFYGAIARGRSVDAAVSSGRVAIIGLSGQTLEWVTPVLYLRGNDGHLFKLPSTAIKSDPDPQANEASNRRKGLDIARYGQPQLTIVTVLYLAANPINLPRLRVDQELRQIQTTIRLGRERDRFRLVSISAARATDIAAALIDNNPQIVHFTGNASREGLIFEDEYGVAALLPSEGIAGLFQLAAGSISCVILAASNTAEMAKSITPYVEYVVAFNEISDKGALAFSVGFYEGLAAGEPIPAAFDRATVYLKVNEHSNRDMPLMFINET